MGKVTWGDRVRAVESRRLGTVWAVVPPRLLVAWDEPAGAAKSTLGFIDAVQCEVLPSYLRGVDGRLRRGYDYHQWRADHGAPMDYEAALLEEASVLIDGFYGP